MAKRKPRVNLRLKTVNYRNQWGVSFDIHGCGAEFLVFTVGYLKTEAGARKRAKRVCERMGFLDKNRFELQVTVEAQPGRSHKEVW